MSEEYLGDIASPAGQTGRAPGLDAVLAALATLSVDVGGVRANVEHLTTGHVDLARQLRPLSGLPAVVEQLRAEANRVPELAEEVSKLADSVGQMLDNPPAKAPSPQDWTHVPAADRREWLEELLAWVRDVLFTGWPWTATRLRACWPRHLDLVNDVAMLRCLYQTAYDHAGGRAHHAVEFRRSVDDVMATANERTRACPPPNDGRPHLVPIPPRDDSTHLNQAVRIAILAEFHQLQEQANHPQTPQDLRADVMARARHLSQLHHITQEEYATYENALAASKAHAATITNRPQPTAARSQSRR
ncbi:hypothetical protein ACIBHY_53930 [Nonomuraea sp. NPDC050547]|uniref:hypothetical protein n=1 Tax=Nonomuraea sp. NPDC050547 TaxID=3364368 RepID=UPI0037AD76A4